MVNNDESILAVGVHSLDLVNDLIINVNEVLVSSDQSLLVHSCTHEITEICLKGQDSILVLVNETF